MLTVAIGACTTAPVGTPSARPVATGVVVAVEGEGPASVTGFTVRTDAGEVLEFDVGRLEVTDGGKTAPHLREHLVDGAPITVEYELRDGRNVAVRYRDAP